MLVAMALICSLATTPDLADCNATNAVGLFWVPEDFRSPFTCLQHGQAYVASTEMGRTITANEAVKVVCIHRH